MYNLTRILHIPYPCGYGYVIMHIYIRTSKFISFAAWNVVVSQWMMRFC